MPALYHIFTPFSSNYNHLLLPSIRQNVLSFLSPTYIKPYPQRTRERLCPESQRTVPFAIEALGGRIMAAEPEHHFKGLRGELPS